MKARKNFSLLVIFSFLFLCNCTENEGEYNQHHQTPQVQQSEPSSELSPMDQAIASLQRQRGLGHQALRDFFEEHLTVDKLNALARDRDTEDLRALTQFHLKFHQEYGMNSEDRPILSKLAFDYYQRLLEVCAGDIQVCGVIGLYRDSVYAGDLFLSAEPLIPAGDKETFILFATQVGRPTNNLHVLKKRLEFYVSDLESDQDISRSDLDRLTNLLIFLSTKSQNIPSQPIQSLYKLTQRHPHNVLLRRSFEKILLMSLEKSDRSEDMELAKNYALRAVRKSQLVETIQYQQQNGLIHWKGQLPEFSIQDDWKTFYALFGFLHTEFSGEIHNFIFQQLIENSEGRDRLFDMARSFIFKKFVINAYLSHETIGEKFVEAYTKWGKVEAMFAEFFPKADATLAEIWNNSYKREVNSLISGITPYYSSERIKELTTIESYLDNNIRNIVAFPTQFIAGYFAYMQGNFDFKLMTMGGTVVHLSDNYFSKELFEGSVPVFFNFITTEKPSGQEALLSFLISLDERILTSYGLDASFVESFIDRYLEPEKRYLVERTRELETRFNSAGPVLEMLSRCELMDQGQFDFGYNHSFRNADNYFFKGQVYYQASYSGTSYGTSRDMVSLLNIFNSQDIKKTLSEDMEFLRLELGPKMNRLRLLLQALKIQQKDGLANKVQARIDQIQAPANALLLELESRFKETISCAQAHHEVERKMRTEFFQKEIVFAKSLYKALNLLNQFDGKLPSIEALRQSQPDLFDEALFSELPESGDLLSAMNKVWHQYGKSWKSQIRYYGSRIETQIGFNKNTSGRYSFFTNRFENRFRKLTFINESELKDQEFPHFDLLEVPRDYDELVDIFGSSDDHFYQVDYKPESERVFLYRYFSLTQIPQRSGFATEYDLEGSHVWRIMLLNLSSLIKMKTYSKFEQDYDYPSYREKMKPLLQPIFDFTAQITNRIIKSYNITSEEERILGVVQSQNFTRENKRIPAPNLFYYDTVVDLIELGQFDLFFNTLVSYQLGKFAEFRTGLFGSGNNSSTGKDQNPFVVSWIPDPPTVNEGRGNHIDASDVNGRRSLKSYSLKNGPVARFFDQSLLFGLEPRAKDIIRHDLFHAVLVDRGLADEFISWTHEYRKSPSRQPYRMDLKHQFEPVEDPPLIQESIVSRYYDGRSQFDIETYNVFIFRKAGAQ